MIRDFIKNAVEQCISDKVTQERITRSILLDYDYELKNPTSEFSMSKKDFINPRGRLEHLFLFKHLEQADTKKVERFEDLLNLIALYSYRKKYNTEQFDEEIQVTEARIATEPVVEVDSLISQEAAVQGFWMD